MRTSFSRIRPITLFAFLYMIGLLIMYWLIGDELPFLHPGKEHVYFVFHEDVTRASVGQQMLNSGATSDTIWLEPGTHEIKFEIGGRAHTKSITVTGETYIVLDGNPPYVHGAD